MDFHVICLLSSIIIHCTVTSSHVWYVGLNTFEDMLISHTDLAADVRRSDGTVSGLSNHLRLYAKFRRQCLLRHFFRVCFDHVVVPRHHEKDLDVHIVVELGLSIGNDGISWSYFDEPESVE